MIEITGYDELLTELDRIDDMLRHKVTRDVATAMAEVVAARQRQLCPRGDPADKPELKPLAETIAVEVRVYGDRVLALAGPEYPAGAHAHAVEDGHAEVLWGKPTGRRVGPKPFVRPAIDETQDAQQAAAEGVVAQAVQDFGS